LWGTGFNWLRTLALLNTMLKVQGSKCAAIYQMSNYQILKHDPGFYILIDKAGNGRII
jgi:hypothetical protein